MLQKCFKNGDPLLSENVRLDNKIYSWKILKAYHPYLKNDKTFPGRLIKLLEEAEEAMKKGGTKFQLSVTSISLS
jgi:hypothetical protein